MREHDLAGDWTLRGWRENDWRRSWSFVRTGHDRPDVGPVPMRVPGSVRGALLAAGLLPDPTVGTASREHEWLEHRHWTISRPLPDGLAGTDEPVVVRFDSLDFGGLVLVDDTEVARFGNAALPVALDVTDAVRAGGRTLTVVLDRRPDDLGQVTWTSRVREFKARYSYGWDWMPRLVSTQVAGPVTLRVGEPRIRRLQVGGDLADGTGLLLARADADEPVRLTLTGPGGRPLAPGQRLRVEPDWTWHRLEVGDVPRWRPGAGGTVTVTATVGDHTLTRRVGFRRVGWRPCAGAGPDAMPWVCEVDGDPVLLAGVNWVPIRADYADVTEADYRHRMEQYRRIGINAFRVWGGAMLEQPLFYDLCDEYGFLVWQELPLCSSGLDNTPPHDEEFTTQVSRIASDWAIRLSHHPSLVLWGGGNELSQPEDGTEVPCGLDHPALAAAADAVADADPFRRFVPASPSGPSCWFEPDHAGAGRHHDVHGPWEFHGGWDDWVAYWAADDALLRSEIGFPGCSGWDLLSRCGLTGPVDTPARRADLARRWAHTSAWWLTDFEAWDGTGGLEAYVARSQADQARHLAHAVAAIRDRFPATGGFFVWLGHDAFPCAVSLALLDYDGRPKPVAEALREVLTAAPDRATLAVSA